MPVGLRLHMPDKLEQGKIASGAADDLHANGQAAIVEAGGQGDGGKAEHVDEAGEAAQRVERPGREALGCRIAFGGARASGSP